MTTPQIAIATITWARNDEEGERLSRAIECLARHGLPIVVADGGSEPAIILFLRQFSNITVCDSTTAEAARHARLMTQVKTALAEVSRLNPQVVLYTEPDKQWFFEHRLKTFIDQVPVSGSLGVGVAARDEASFLTYPAFQRYTETVTNQLCAEVMGQQGEFLYGPLILNPVLLPHMERLDEDLGWGWRLFVMVIAQRMGLAVTTIPLDVPCPLDQRDEDDRKARLYRLEQLSHNAKGLVAGARWPLE
jgi:hypothetical protein